MSRSYKRTPGFTDNSSSKIGKRFANKAVRQYKGDIPNGAGYKKLFCSYDICDFKFLYHTPGELADRLLVPAYKAITK